LSDWVQDERSDEVVAVTCCANDMDEAMVVTMLQDDSDVCYWTSCCFRLVVVMMFVMGAFPCRKDISNRTW
jgi:hypothetical protein